MTWQCFVHIFTSYRPLVGCPFIIHKMSLCLLADIGRSGLSIDGPTECLRMNGVECIRKYQLVSIDAASGMICNGAVKLLLPGRASSVIDKYNADTTLYELVVLFGLGTCLIMTRRVLHDILLGSDVDFNLLMKWCGMYKRMDVLANADSVSEVAMVRLA